MAKKCRDCGTLNRNPLMPRCYPCSIAYMKTDEFSEKQEVLRAKSKEREAKRERKRLKDRKGGIKKPAAWAKEAQTAFNRWIRLRDYGLPCISCGNSDRSIQYAAGHYFSVGSSPELRYEPLNVHLQCNKKCNCELSGNLLCYRVRLIDKIGQDKVDWLEGKHEAKHYTIDDFKTIKSTYNKLANELQKQIDKGGI